MKKTQEKQPEKRSMMAFARVTPTEMAVMRKLARAERRTVSDWLRWVALKNVGLTE